MGELILDPNFDGISVESRMYQKQFCKELAEQDFVMKNSVECWFKDFDKWLEQNFKITDSLLIPDKEYQQYLAFWAMDSTEGKEAVFKNHIGLKNDKLLYMEIVG